MEHDDFDADRRQEERESHARAEDARQWCWEHAGSFSAAAKDAYDAYCEAENFRAHAEDNDGMVDADDLCKLAAGFRALADRYLSLAEAMEAEA